MTQENPPTDYETLTDGDAPRDIDVDLPQGGGGKSYSDAEESANPSDIQITLKRLFPKFPSDIIDEIAQVIMIGRISPDVFLDLIYLTITDVVEELEASGIRVRVQSIINQVYAAFSIGLDSKGRIDIVSVYGAERETDELEKLSQQMGMK